MEEDGADADGHRSNENVHLAFCLPLVVARTLVLQPRVLVEGDAELDHAAQDVEDGEDDGAVFDGAAAAARVQPAHGGWLVTKCLLLYAYVA